MWSLASTLLKFIWGLFFPSKKDPTTIQLATSNATAETELAGQETANVIVEKSVAAGNADDARQLRGTNGPNSAVNTATDAPVNTDPNANFRD